MITPMPAAVARPGAQWTRSPRAQRLAGPTNAQVESAAGHFRLCSSFRCVCLFSLAVSRARPLAVVRIYLALGEREPSRPRSHHLQRTMRNANNKHAPLTQRNSSLTLATADAHNSAVPTSICAVARANHKSKIRYCIADTPMAISLASAPTINAFHAPSSSARPTGSSATWQTNDSVDATGDTTLSLSLPV